MADTRLVDPEIYSLLHYDKETGVFRWLKSRGGRLAGSIAGHLASFENRKRQYWVIRYKNRLYLAHVLAWAYVTGAFPDQQIDHEDGNSINNRWSNFRLSTQRQNLHNTKIRSNNSSGKKGVSWDRVNQKWVARIRQPNGPYRNLGRFDLVTDAKAAYDRAALALFGEFARLG